MYMIAQIAPSPASGVPASMPVPGRRSPGSDLPRTIGIARAAVPHPAQGLAPESRGGVRTAGKNPRYQARPGIADSLPGPAGEPGPVARAPAEWLPQELAGLGERELLGIVHSLPRGSGRRDAACGLLVSRHSPLVRICVRRYSRSPELAEDLMQAGYVGLMKAISHFDPAIGASLAAYAEPSITGEIKKHFRDKRWPVHVSRPAKELMLEVRQASGQLTHDLGRVPAESDLARYLGVSDADLRDARRAEMALQPSSLDAPMGETGTGTLADFLGEEDPRIERMLGMRAVAAHWRELPPRERKILIMRFYGDMTQAEIARQLGLSQMHVSRLLTRALGCLRLRCTKDLGQ